MKNPSKSNYSQWIAENQPNSPRGKCEAVTRCMAEAFPELRRVRGHYVCPTEGRLPHWWMVTPDGQVIDPTQDQFFSMKGGTYEEHVGPEPTGTCLNCGALMYGDVQWVCNEACGNEFTVYLEESVKDINETQS